MRVFSGCLVYAKSVCLSIILPISCSKYSHIIISLVAFEPEKIDSCQIEEDPKHIRDLESQTAEFINPARSRDRDWDQDPTGL